MSESSVVSDETFSSVPKKRGRPPKISLEEVTPEKPSQVLPDNKVAAASDVSIDELVEQRVQERLAQIEKDKSSQHLKNYTSDEKCTLSDPDFIQRCYNLNIPKENLIYLSDNDKVLSTNGLWAKLRQLVR